MPNAVAVTPITRTPHNKGDRVVIEVIQYDNGLWSVNKEPCVDRKEVDRVVGNVIGKLQ